MEKSNLLLFSRVKATVVRNGEPVVGAKIERSTFWNMEKYPRLDYTYTNEHGEFEFPEIRGSADFGWLARLFHHPSINQRIYLWLNSVDRAILYSNSKHDYLGQSGTGVSEIKIDCDVGSLEQYGENRYEAACRVILKCNNSPTAS